MDVDDDDRTSAIAVRLADIATVMAGEASDLTQSVRTIGGHVREIAALAADLDEAACSIEEAVHAQLQVLNAAMARVAENEPVMASLAGSTQVIADMSRSIAEVARRSRLLALNARIEASRTDAGGNGFAVVAGEMTDLSHQTQQAATQIVSRAQSVDHHLRVARSVLDDDATLFASDQRAMVAIAATTRDQCGKAGAVKSLTADMVAQIDATAAGIGRVASAASIVGLLAKQMMNRPPAVR